MDGPGQDRGGAAGARPVRITWLVHQYPPRHVAGTELYTHGLARRALHAGHDVLVVCAHEHPSTDPSDHGVREREHEGVPVAEIEHHLPLAPSVARWEHDNPHVAAAVAGLLRRFAPDVVHCTHAMKLGVGALDVCRAMEVPVVVTLTDYWYLCLRHTLLTHDGRLCGGPTDADACFACMRATHDVPDEPAERAAVAERPARLMQALAEADRVIALSRFQRDVHTQLGLAPDRVTLLPHGIEPEDLDAPRPPRPRGRPPRLVFIGTLREHKGAHVAVEALARAPDLDAELVLYGSGGSGSYGDSLAAAADRDARVRLAGVFAPSELGEVLADADALLVPAQWYENDPLVVKAAVHVGVPVVASRLGTLTELVRDGDGWTVPHDDIAAWTEAVRRAAAEAPSRARRPRRQPTMDQHWDAVEAVYRELSPRAEAVA
jgi:glycosyltransferase involved in cell wall biosynthesis